MFLTAAAAFADPPRGYWVQSTGSFDRFPFPPAIGGQNDYHPGRPWVTLHDSYGSQVSMPLQPKVLYYSTPFATPAGSYYPRTITMIPDDHRRGVPERVRVLPTFPPPTTFRYDGGPPTPVPTVPPEPIRNR